MRLKFLLLNQTFHPDVMATGQYLSEVALQLAKRGHQVTVVTGRRAYDEPKRTFGRKEIWQGVRIYRVGSTWFGKDARWKRWANFSSYLISCAARLLRLPRHNVVLALTSPPMVGLLGAWLARLHGGHFIYWIMDFNPDEAIAAGWLKPAGPMARLLDWISCSCLKRADKIIALDWFMRSRILAKNIPPSKIVVLPLWAQNVGFDRQGRNHFRRLHGMEGKFVVMYSGNHSPCHPLESLLKAAQLLAQDRRILFCFIGGGSEFRKLQQMQRQGNLAKILCLPYQPLSRLSESLSAADLHVVIMGDPFVGLVHPCKIYNLLNLGLPLLYIGPERSPVSDLLASSDLPATFAARHGEVESIRDQIREACKQRSRWVPKAGPESGTAPSQESVVCKLIAQLESAGQRRR